MNKTWATHGDKTETKVTQLLHNFNYLVTISGAYLCHVGTGQQIAIFLYSHLLKMVVFVLTILEQNKWLFVRCSMKVKWALNFFWKMVVFCSHLLNKANDCSKEEEWFHFLWKWKELWRFFFILDDFSIFSVSVMSYEDFFFIKKKWFLGSHF